MCFTSIRPSYLYTPTHLPIPRPLLLARKGYNVPPPPNHNNNKCKSSQPPTPNPQPPSSKLRTHSAEPSQPERHQLHPLEKQWLIDAHIEYIISQRENLINSRIPWQDMDWELTARHFNARFEGEYLSGFSERRWAKGGCWLEGECGGMREVRELKGVWGWVRRVWGGGGGW